MPDWKTVKEAFIDRSKLSQAIYKARGYATPGMQDIENERESRKLALESARYSAARRPIEDRIQDDNAAWAEEQRSFERPLLPLKQKVAEQGLADVMALAPSDRIEKIKPIARKVVVDQIMKNSDPVIGLTPQDAEVLANDPRFMEQESLYIIGDLANKAEGGDEVAQHALDEQLQRTNKKLITTPQGKFVHDNITKEDIPYTKDAYIERWHKALRGLATETSGLSLIAKNLQSAGGRISNAVGEGLVAADYYKPEDSGHAAVAVFNAATDGIKIDKNTPQEERIRLGREMTGYDLVGIMDEFAKSHDSGQRQTMLSVAQKKNVPGPDGKLPLGGTMTIVNSGDFPEPWKADPNELVWKFVPEGVNQEPVILPTAKMASYLSARNPVVRRLTKLQESLAANKAVADQKDIDKEDKLYQRKLDAELLRQARPLSPEDQRKADRDQAETEIPIDDNASVGDRREKVNKRAAEIAQERRTGKSAPVLKSAQSPDDYINNAIGE